MSRDRDSAPPPEVRAARELPPLLTLQRVNNLLPDGQDLLTVEPALKVKDAITLMRRHNYSHLPIVSHGSVLGVFSYRSFANGLLRLGVTSVPLQELAVSDFAERVPFARIDDEMETILRALDKYDVVLVGDANRIQAIATPVDVLQHLYRIASPFVIVQVIELALRELIRASVDDPQLTECVRRSLSSRYGPELPSSLEQMTFSDYIALITNGDNWALFSTWAGGNRKFAQARLRPIVDLRNDIMHFRRDISAEDYDLLDDVRQWLLMSLRQLGWLASNDERAVSE
jgi:CBS domain-containing protein